MSQMDQAVICFSTQVSAQAFIDAQKAIPTTKGCGVIRALHFQGQRVLDACSPLGDASREWSPEIAGKIEQTRKELRRIETLMQRIKDLNSHCFGGEEPEKKPRKKRQRDKDRDINYPQDDYRRALPA